VDRHVGLSREQRQLNLNGEDSLAAKSGQICLQVAVASRVNENQLTVNTVYGQELTHGVRLHEG
jgi:hypothetical protein